MLVLGRNEGQWIEVRHAASGDVLRFRVYGIVGPEPGRAGRTQIAFDDDARNFAIDRAERLMMQGDDDA